MSELRKDPIVDRWVIVAGNRAARPHQLFDGEVNRASRDDCPFCEGHEHDTPREILAYRAPGTLPDGIGWQLRVVPNKFPAVETAGRFAPIGQGLYALAEGFGAHEVIIESPRHLTSVTELSDLELADVMWCYRERLIDLRRDERLRHANVFKNVGAAAGASLEHTHSQLIALPIVPVAMAEELAGAQSYLGEHGRCVYCDMLEQERQFAGRMVCESGGFAAFCPFAGRFPFETWVLPRSHASHYETLSRAAALELAQLIRQVLSRMETALGQPAYNYVIKSAPFDTNALGHYHWHIEIFPRVTKAAGFEWGTGFFINPVPPEEAATVLRRARMRTIAR